MGEKVSMLALRPRFLRPHHTPQPQSPIREVGRGSKETRDSALIASGLAGHQAFGALCALHNGKAPAHMQDGRSEGLFFAPLMHVPALDSASMGQVHAPRLDRGRLGSVGWLC